MQNLQIFQSETMQILRKWISSSKLPSTSVELEEKFLDYQLAEVTEGNYMELCH